MTKIDKRNITSEIIPNIILIILFIASVVGVFFLANKMYFDTTRCCHESGKDFSSSLSDDVNNINIKSKSGEEQKDDDLVNNNNNQIKWSVSEKVHINEKNVTLIKTAGTGDCYIIKDVNENNLMKKGVLRIVQELSKKQLLYIVGEFGINYCGDVSSYLVQEKISKKDDNFNDVRRRRHEDPQKLPNCKDILLDCTPNLIGKTTECGTWRDQQMNMERVCLSPTEFQITLHKPSEMMANKLHDETRLLCIERIRNGLSC